MENAIKNAEITNTLKTRILNVFLVIHNKYV